MEPTCTGSHVFPSTPYGRTVPAVFVSICNHAEPPWVRSVPQAPAYREFAVSNLSALSSRFRLQTAGHPARPRILGIQGQRRPPGFHCRDGNIPWTAIRYFKPSTGASSFGNPKVSGHRPRIVCHKIENSAVFPVMRRSSPLQCAHPTGAKFPANRMSWPSIGSISFSSFDSGHIRKLSGSRCSMILGSRAATFRSWKRSVPGVFSAGSRLLRHAPISPRHPHEERSRRPSILTHRPVPHRESLPVIGRNAGIQIRAEHFRWLASLAKNACRFYVLETPFGGYFGGHSRLAADDPFRPVRIHHVTRPWAWRAVASFLRVDGPRVNLSFGGWPPLRSCWRSWARRSARNTLSRD